jgi:hypothetical protein
VKIDLDAFPWDLTIRVGGRDYPTRPFTMSDLLADVAAPDLPAEKPKDEAVIRQCMETVRRVFPEGGAPDLERLDWQNLLTIRGAYAEYSQDLLKKKRDAATRSILGQASQDEPSRGPAPQGREATARR